MGTLGRVRLGNMGVGVVRENEEESNHVNVKDSGRSRRMSDVSKVVISGLTLTGLLAGGGEARQFHGRLHSLKHRTHG